MLKLLIVYITYLITFPVWSSCELLESGSKSPHGNRQLSTYWAQEFTGADLVRTELISENISLPQDFIGVWDAKPRLRNNHGEKVSQLIAGPHLSALIPSEEPVQYLDVEFERDLMKPADKFIKLFQECSAEKNCPEFINNSMSWLEDSEIQKTIAAMAERGILVVTSAGNGRRSVEAGKRDLAAKNQIVVVGNTNVNGFPAKYTDSAPEVTISAPSDNYLTTFDYAGNIKNFSGTSGSAPQVLASIASFRMVSGVRVDGELAKALLQSTALKILPQPNNIGSGTLNAYKIFELAKLVKSKCRDRSKACALKIVNDDKDMVSYQEERKLMRKLRRAFPSCANGSTHDHFFPNTSCRRKRLAFMDLRRAALLKTNDPKLWDILSCITANEELSRNAQFYKNLSHHVAKSNTSKIEEYYKFNTDADLIKFTLSNPAWIGEPEHVIKVISRAKADWTVDNYLLTNKPWYKYFKTLLEENRAPAEELSASKIREFL